jgi:aminopeptidase-like protein
LRHLHTDPQHPQWIPYRNSFYKENWGFCVAHERLNEFTDDVYDVCIDATLADGHLTYGEAVLPGATSREVLISTHVCHPSLANDNLSGLVVAALLARHLRELRTRYTYRVLFVPCTIGPIAWLGRNPDVVPRIDHGLVLACLGDAGGFTYVRSRRDDAEIDRTMRHALASSVVPSESRPFAPYGYDQRQYCSPGFNLPMGCLMRTPNGEYPGYHTSGDNLDLLRPQALAESLLHVLTVIAMLEDNRKYLATVLHGEPQLGRRGLYDQAQEFGLFWLLNFSDGEHSVLDIAEKSGVPFQRLAAGVRMLKGVDLLKDAP